jgi:deoxyadenosine/deoxycytidine kinase
VSKSNLVIGVVGVCGSGKTELVQRLRARGFQARHIAQEHSYTPDMWQRISNPDILVYLDVSYHETLERKRFDWSERDYQEQCQRVQHAQQHADLIINTDDLTPDDVFIDVLHNLGIE